MSTLERLFTYAKASEVSARENFTTEALAGAIRVQPEPFIELLREKGLLPSEELTELNVQTQIAVPGGYLDLVVSLIAGTARMELWGELKVDAGESGSQIDVYRRLIGEIPESLRPTLFTLGSKPLRNDPSLPFVSWHDLRRQVLKLDVVPAWADLAAYLAEIKMSDDFDQPVTAHEAGSMADFALLLGKTGRILEGVSTRAQSRWPLIGWPSDRAGIMKELTRRIWEHHDLFVLSEPRGRPRTVYIAVGLRIDDGEAAASIDVGTYPAQAALQRELVALADAAALHPAWHRSFGNWGGLRVNERLVLLRDHEAAEEWFLGRLSELDDAGVMNRITSLSTHDSRINELTPPAPDDEV